MFLVQRKESSFKVVRNAVTINYFNWPLNSSVDRFRREERDNIVYVGSSSSSCRFSVLPETGAAISLLERLNILSFL